ncbi:unnamed protein product, partial [Allacma fusca]
MLSTHTEDFTLNKSDNTSNVFDPAESLGKMSMTGNLVLARDT